MELYEELIMQPTFLTCGQACIAMIAGKSVEEVIKDMKTDGATSIGQLIEILDVYGIGHAERNKRISKKNPVPYQMGAGICCICRMIGKDSVVGDCICLAENWDAFDSCCLKFNRLDFLYK